MLQKTISADFQCYSPNTKFMWLMVFRLLFIYTTAQCRPLAPIHRYHIYWKYSIPCTCVFVSVSVLLFFFFLHSPPALSLSLSFMLYSKCIYYTYMKRPLFLIKLIIQSIYKRDQTLNCQSAKPCRNILRKRSIEKFPKCIHCVLLLAFYIHIMLKLSAAILMRCSCNERERKRKKTERCHEDSN